MTQQQPRISWKRVAFKVGIGMLFIAALTAGYDAWRKRDGYCVDVYSQKPGDGRVLYGDACNK